MKHDDKGGNTEDRVKRFIRFKEVTQPLSEVKGHICSVVEKNLSERQSKRERERDGDLRYQNPLFLCVCFFLS